MRHRRGFTMIEIAIVLSLLLVMLGPLFLVEQKMRVATQRLAERASAHQEARQMMARIARDLRNHTVTLTARCDGYRFPGVTCEVSQGRLLRNGVAIGSLPVDDLVIWPEGKTLHVTLAVRSGQGRWTMVSRVERP